MSRLEKVANILTCIVLVLVYVIRTEWSSILAVVLVNIVAIMAIIMYVKKLKEFPFEALVIIIGSSIFFNISLFIKLVIKNNTILAIISFVYLLVLVIYGLVKKTYKM